MLVLRPALEVAKNLSYEMLEDDAVDAALQNLVSHHLVLGNGREETDGVLLPLLRLSSPCRGQPEGVLSKHPELLLVICLDEVELALWQHLLAGLYAFRCSIKLTQQPSLHS